jgi:glycosyl transferase family 25
MTAVEKLKAFLINLDTSTERLASAKHQLDVAGLPFQRVPAFDGRRCDPGTFPEYDERKALTWFGRKLSGGELGCYFSHIDCAKRFLATDAEFGLSLEDDLSIRPDASQVIGQLSVWLEEGNLPNWRMVNLGRPVKRFFSPVATFEVPSGNYTLCRAHYFPDTTTAILWSREGAERFLETANHIFAPIDHFLRLWNTDTDAGLGFIATPITTTGAASDINQAKTRQDTSRASFYHLRKHRRLLANKRNAKRNMRSFQFSGEQRPEATQ